jgi:signal transduction histidine kinase
MTARRILVMLLPILAAAFAAVILITSDGLVDTLVIAAAGVGSMALAVLVTRTVLTRDIDRPRSLLVQGIRSIGEGELTRTIDLGAPTELDAIADAVNTSTVELASLFSRLERQRDDFEVLYWFTDAVSRAVRPSERRSRVVELATRFLGAECVLIRVDDPTRTQSGTGRITMREAGAFEDHLFTFGPEGQRGVPTFLDGIIRQWLGGEYDGETEVSAGWVVVYPLRIQERPVGLLLVPAEKSDDGAAGPAVGAELVHALTQHVAIALEFSDLQSELVGQERLAAIGETVAGLAHCLKNTLNGLRAGQYVIDRAVKMKNQDKIRKGWRVLKAGISKVETLTFNMLYVIKERKPQREPVDPNEVLREVADIMRQAATDRGLEIRLQLDDAIGEHPLDRMTIYRAVLNLVSNALDACLESDEGSAITITSLARPEDVRISITDDGIGMSAEIRARLFTRFFSTKQGRGTGLGLSVVQKIIEEHGGRLSVESVEGEGSTFHIHLPRSEPETETDG